MCLKQTVGCFMILFLTVIVPGVGGADMIVKLKDGSTVRVPVKEEDVVSISYDKDAGQAVDSIHIKEARYGVSRVRGSSGASFGYRHDYCDAKKALKKVCEGQQECSVTVGNDLCGDPAPSYGKELVVQWTCGRQPNTSRADEGSTLRLSCP